MVKKEKLIYLFGEGSADMKNILGGKGANLSEMTRMNIPVPPGFTITTDVCNIYYQDNMKFSNDTIEQIKNGISWIEKKMNQRFGDPVNPLLLSVRSGARVSMPGMMDTVLNLGLNDDAARGLIRKTGNERWVWDSYRRFIQMFGDVVLGVGTEKKDEVDPFESIIEQYKNRKKIKQDTDLTSEDLKKITYDFKEYIKKRTGSAFPDDPWVQLWKASGAVFKSWMNDRAVKYRKINGIPSEWGTAVNIQTMVFGNIGEKSGTGVAFTRDPATGENLFFGEYLINAQGEDVVAGTRTPYQVTLEGSRRWAARNGIPEDVRAEKFPSMEEKMPEQFHLLTEIYKKLENHFKDMQDIEFTIQDGKLWLLQTRTGKRTAKAAVRIAVDMVGEGMIDKQTAVLRISPDQIDQILHPNFDPAFERKNIARGLPASPGAASGKVVFNAEDAEEWASRGEETILVRIETSPEDIGGMKSANGILTSRGGMTSHAAVVARGMGKCCVSGCTALKIDYHIKTIQVNDAIIREGEWISLDGSTGEVMIGKIPTILPEIGVYFARLLSWADDLRRMGVRANSDTPEDSEIARKFGAEGIGLCRTEHMFFEGERIRAMREMILAEDLKGRKAALEKLRPMQMEDFYEIFRIMKGLPVTIRLLDPPLHEFLPHDEKTQDEIAFDLGVPLSKIKERIDSLKEFNPMLGHRGCRLGITYPEITEMQITAIIQAAIRIQKEGEKVLPEIMVPLVGTLEEFDSQKEVIDETAKRVMSEEKLEIEYLVGTMIEIPRAALTADQIASAAEFFSFGTNDLTQMCFGYSRDDSGSFLPEYLEKGILKYDPFKVIDRIGVGSLISIGIEKGRKTNPELKIGICGEHGGDPSSIEYCNDVNMDYVSCSPYRVPIARLAAAQAEINRGHAGIHSSTG